MVEKSIKRTMGESDFKWRADGLELILTKLDSFHSSRNAKNDTYPFIIVQHTDGNGQFRCVIPLRRRLRLVANSQLPRHTRFLLLIEFPRLYDTSLNDDSVSNDDLEWHSDDDETYYDSQPRGVPSIA